MHNIKRLGLYILVSSIYSTLALSKFDNAFNYSLGLVNSSITETDSSITSTDTVSATDDELSSSELSVISQGFGYEYAYNNEFTGVVKAIVPLVTADGTGVFAASVGVNWYLNGMSSRYVLKLNNNEIKMVPKLRYYVGGGVGLGYLAFTTESAKKTDVSFELMGHAGGSYAIDDDWTALGQFVIGKGTGVTTSSINIAILFGIGYYL